MELYLSIIVILLLCGIAAGFFAGLFGIGGGVIMVPVMFFLLSDLGYEEDAMTMAVATSAAVILPTVITGTIRNYRREGVSWWPALILGAGGILGSVCGSTLSVLIPQEIHVIAFSCFLLVLAGWMGSCRCRFVTNHTLKESGRIFLFLGILAGVAAGLFGIGGGVVLTPVLTSLLGMNIRRSINLSLASMIIIASGTVLSYIILGWELTKEIPYSIGYINLLFAALLICASIPAVHLGVIMRKRISEQYLHFLFIGMLVILAIRMLLSA